MKANAWDLYRRAFKEGDEVIAIDELDNVYWGKLSTQEDGVTLRLAKRSFFLCWEEIRFMSHDGFPVKQLLGRKQGEAILVEPSAKEVIRAALSREFTGNPKVAVKVIDHVAPYSRRRFIFGDPFEITVPCKATIYNMGQTGEFWFGQDYEECVLLEAPDGAMAQLFDLDTVFEFEDAA